MRRKFEDYDVEVISLEKLYPKTEWHQRFLKFKELLEEQEIEILVWVCFRSHVLCFWPGRASANLVYR